MAKRSGTPMIFTPDSEGWMKYFNEASSGYHPPKNVYKLKSRHKDHQPKEFEQKIKMVSEIENAKKMEEQMVENEKKIKEEQPVSLNGTKIGRKPISSRAKPRMIKDKPDIFS